MRNILEVKNLVRSYNTATFRDSKNNVNVLKGISFQVAEGEFVGIMGKSGCGKTTLLKTLGMIDKPTDGTIKFMGEDTSELYGDKLADIRNSKIGFIFQDFYLMDSLSVEENIMLPMIISKQNINKMIASFYKGEGILEGVWLNEDGSIMQTNEVHKVGESITIQTSDGKQRRYTVLGHVKLGEGVVNSGIYGDDTFELYLSSDSYKDLIEDPKIMVYSFNVKKGEESHAKDIMNALSENYSEIDYRSKESYTAEFQTLKTIVEMVSVILCIVFSIIAFVNLINIFLTSVVMRKNEFATLRSIGMTRRQMRKVLLYEILYYTSVSVIFAVCLSFPVSMTIIKNICNSMDFLSYSYKSDIFVGIYVIIFIIDLCMVCIIEKYMNRDAIAVQLKN